MLIDELYALQDKKYKAFHEKLIPTVPKDTIIGIRTPVLRKFSKEFAKREESKAFLKNLPHRYYEENNLHAFLLEQMKEFDLLITETEHFLPVIDNWATCDMFRPKQFAKHTEELYPNIKNWLCSSHPYTQRYAIGMLLSFYLDAAFQTEQMELVASVRSDEYYVNMMIAWYFATALAKHYDEAIPYLREEKLSPWVHNKAIQKAVESKRISEKIKNNLKAMKK